MPCISAGQHKLAFVPAVQRKTHPHVKIERVIHEDGSHRDTAALVFVINPHHPNVLRTWQNTILEYEVRLLEFQRLYENESDAEAMQEAANQVATWSRKYWSAVGLGKSKSKLAWEEKFAPDLQELRKEVGSLLINFNALQ